MLLTVRLQVAHIRQYALPRELSQLAHMCRYALPRKASVGGIWEGSARRVSSGEEKPMATAEADNSRDERVPPEVWSMTGQSTATPLMLSATQLVRKLGSRP